MKVYSKGKIYRIVGNGYTYYGSTCEPTLARRLAKHRSNYTQFLNGKYHFVTSYKCFENCNCDYYIVLVENYPCQNKDELHKRERYYIEHNECINKNIPNRGIKERNKHYYNTNLEKLLANKKEYYSLHKVKYQHTHICICGGIYCDNYKARHLKSTKHTSFMNRLNSPDKEIAFDAIMEIHNRPRHELF